VVTSKERWPYLPEVPTLLESGYKFFQSSYLSLGAPAGTAEAIRNKIEDAFRKVMENPAIKEEFQKKLFATLGYQSGAEYAKYIREQHVYYKDFLKEHGIKP
jgi:tripartite-type tricarboxylate transporter receptor subunit TctC